MCPPEPDSPSTGRLARYTPDGRRWRYTLAGVGAVAAPVLFYYTTRLVSSTWSGPLPSLLVLVGSVLTLVAAALVPTLLLAPDGAGTRDGPDDEDTPVAELKRRYAAGELSEPEFERRLEALIGAPAEEEGRSDTDSGREPERARRPVDVESELD